MNELALVDIKQFGEFIQVPLVSSFLDNLQKIKTVKRSITHGRRKPFVKRFTITLKTNENDGNNHVIINFPPCSPFAVCRLGLQCKNREFKKLLRRRQRERHKTIGYNENKGPARAF